MNWLMGRKRDGIFLSYKGAKNSVRFSKRLEWYFRMWL